MHIWCEKDIEAAQWCRYWFCRNIKCGIYYAYPQFVRMT